MNEYQGEQARNWKIENSNGKNENEETTREEKKSKNEGMSGRKTNKAKIDSELDNHEVYNNIWTKVECNNIANEKG